MDILPECRRDYLLCFLIKAQFQHPEIFLHLLFANLCSQNPVNPFRVKFHPYRLPLLGIDIKDPSHHLTGAQFFNKLTGPVNSRLGIIRIQTLLKLSGGIGPKTYLFGGQPDIGAVKAGCLKYHRLYLIRNLGIFPSHDSGNAYLLFPVIDHQNRMVQLADLPV